MNKDYIGSLQSCLPSFLQRTPERAQVPLPSYAHENKLLLVEQVLLCTVFKAYS